MRMLDVRVTKGDKQAPSFRMTSSICTTEAARASIKEIAAEAHLSASFCGFLRQQ